MPTAHLIDPAQLDFSEVHATREDIREVLRQRDAFEMLDGILQPAAENQPIIGFKDIRADDWWVSGHIPGRPLFPGALMIESGAQVCSYDFLTRHSDGMRDRFLGFGGVDKARFRGVVEPGSRMIFAAEARRLRSRMFTYYVQGFARDELVFETEILGLVVS